MVYWCGAPVLRKQRGMKVECPERRHAPNFLWKHPEGHHHKEISINIPQGGNEFRITQFLRLKECKIMFQGILFHRAEGDLAAATGRPVRNSDHCSDVKPRFMQGFQARNSKLRRPHEYYTQR